MKRHRATGLRLVLVAVLSTAAVFSMLPGLPAPPAADAQVPGSGVVRAAVPRPLPPPAHVRITATGYEPANLTVVKGQAIEFANESGAEQTVAAPESYFDSGPIPSGGGYSLTLGESGFNSYASPGLPGVFGSITVATGELPGLPGALLNTTLPDLPLPPVVDLDVIPELGIGASRTRIMVMFTDTATVADANAAIAAAGVNVLGTIPTMKAVVVAAADAGVGNFGPTTTAEASLRANSAVVAASLDLERGPEAVPPRAETKLDGTPSSSSSWTWEDERSLASPDFGRGNGGNYGLEMSRFPQAWNLVDAVRSKRASIDTLVLDAGFHKHEDLPAIEVKPLCSGTVSPTSQKPNCTADDISERHATHVSGIIGALWGNPMTGSPSTGSPAQPGRARGVDGANPVVHLYGAPINGLGGNIFPGQPPHDTTEGTGWTSSTVNETFALAIKGKSGGLWPNLRVINISSGEFKYRRGPAVPPATEGPVLWGNVQSLTRCGPEDNDDAVSNGPCTPSTEDRLRKEVKAQARFAREAMRLASGAGVMLVLAAGNEGNEFCISGNIAPVPPLSPAVYAFQTGPQGPCLPGDRINREDTKRISSFGFASAEVGDTNQNPVITVEAVNGVPALAEFSNSNGDVSAPGVKVLSTINSNQYDFDSGTSMSAPYVTALVGLLVANRPTMSVTDIRRAVKNYAVPDAGGAPRIDAYGSMLAGSPDAARSLVDVGDGTMDGNRRTVVGRDGSITLDKNLGPTIGDAQLHSQPDSLVGMSDFRRYRDAVLEACTGGVSRESPGARCPTPDQIRLDGGDNHPKKDLNLDGCVKVDSDPVCTQPEDAFSRFDFNGDAKLSYNETARLPLTHNGDDGTVPSATRVAGEEFTDLQLLQAWFSTAPEQSEGWTKAKLDELMTSADVEVHADDLFRAGATQVDVEVQYGGGIPAPSQILTKGAKTQAMVTVPVPKEGGPVSVSGVGRDAGGNVVSRSQTDQLELHPGEDHRTDLCTPTVTVVPTDRNLFADGQDSTNVNVTVSNCGQPVGAGVTLVNDVRLVGSAGPPTATLSAPSSVTDAEGRATFNLKTANTAEKVRIVVKAQVELDPSHPGLEELTGTTDVDITTPPRVIYKWEQVTDDWHMHDHVADSFSSADTDYKPDSNNPLVIGRAGTLTPSGNNDAFLVEHVGANRVGFHFDSVSSDGSTSSGNSGLEIPVSQRVPDPRGPVSNLVTNRWDEHGVERTQDQWTFATTKLDVRNDQVTVERFRDLDSNWYRYDETPAPCVNSLCRTRPELDQITLTPRENGSSIAFADDLDRDLTFRRLPNGSFSTYHWCSQPKTFEMRGLDALPQFREITGTAHSKFRFIATVTTDPNMTGDQLVLPASCEASVAPIAAISRDFVTAVEGQVVQYLDASSDPNGDITTWAWDFGDGTTSTEQDPEHRYDDDGKYRVTLKVTDSAGLTNSTSIDVEIINGAPEISADDVAVDNGQPAVVNLRLFDPSERDQEDLRLSVRWDDNGSPFYPEVHTPGGALAVNLGGLPEGERRLQLTVQDKDGKSASTTITVKVGGTEPPLPVLPDEIETVPAPGCAYGVKQDTREQELGELLSGYRESNGREGLEPSPTLTAAALAHARWLRDNDKFQHEGAGGSTAFTRATAAHYPGALVAENLVRGPNNGPGALVAWKMSSTHDANLLDARLGAYGLAAVDTVHGTLWVLVLGDKVDCPEQPPVFDSALDPPDPFVAPVGTPQTEVLASREGATEPTTTTPTAPESTPEPSARNITVAPDKAPPTDGGSAPAGLAAGASPAAEAAPSVVAFTVSSTAPLTGEAVTVTNRSAAPIDMAPGDGRPASTVAPNASTQFDYLDPGTFSIRATLGSLVAVHEVVVSGTPRPPVLTYDGPTNAAFGARPVLSATLKTTTGSPVSGRLVRFVIEGRELTATTGADGKASVTLVADQAPGPHTLLVDVPALASGPGASKSLTFTVGPNAPPVVNAHGPYDVVIGEPLVLNTQGSTDPDNTPFQSVLWDLDHDGQFDDATGDATIPPATVAALICGGTCDPATPRPIAVAVTDAAGAVTIVETEMRSRRDFVLSVNPTSAVLNPGGATSFQVTVSTSSGFADPVTLSAPSLPPGVTASFSPQSVMPHGTSLLTLFAAPNVQEFDGQFLIQGTSGSIVHQNPGTVDVEFGLIPLCFGAADVRVTDAVTGLPVPGASVGNLITDANGEVHLRDLQLGQNNSPVNMQFGAIAPGDYIPAFKTQLIGCGTTTKVELSLAKRQFGGLTGRLVVGIPDPNNHTASRPVTPTEIPVVGTVNVIGGPVQTTSADGRFAFDRVLASGFNVDSSSTGYWPERRIVNIPANGTATVMQALVPQCTGSIDVRVRNTTTGLPMPDALVTVTSRGQLPVDAAGRLRVSGIPLGPRNSAISVGASAQATVDGVPISGGASSILADCGHVAQVDIGLTPRVKNYAAFSGRVTETASGDPVAGLTVSFTVPGLTSGNVQTDSDGRYAFSNIFIGYDGTTSNDAIVSVAPPNQADWITTGARRVRLSTDQPAVQDLTISRRQYSTADVRVIDAATGEPIFGADVGPGVSITGVPVDHLVSQKTGADGYVRFTRIPTNNVPVLFGADTLVQGYLRASQNIFIAPGENGTIVLALTRVCAPGNVQGIVRNATTGEPLPGASVSPNVPGHNQTTGADGRFRITELEVTERRPTSYVITASKVGFQPASRAVTMFCGGNITIDIGAANTGAGSLSGRVTRADTGLPVAGVVVGGEWGGVATTDADGRYSFASVPLDGAVGERNWTVTFQPPYDAGLGETTRTVTIRPNAASVLDVALGGPRANQRPVAQSKVIDMAAGQSSVATEMVATDADGDPITYRIANRSPNLGASQDNLTGRVTLELNGASTTEGTLTYVATDGRQDSLPATITIRRPAPPVNQPPTARITVSFPGPYPEQTSFILDGSTSSDPEGSIGAYAWDLDNDGQYDDGFNSSMLVRPPDNGPYTYGLRVTEFSGQLSATTSITITVDNVKPVVNAGADLTVGADRRLQRAGSFTDPGADTWTATVDWGEGSGKQPLALTARTFALDHTFATGGTKKVSIEVCDDDGGCGTDTLLVTVPGGTPNTPPTAVIAPLSPVVEGTTVALSGSGSSDAEGPIASYAWDFDNDGQFDDATGPAPSMPTADDGPIAIGLRVTDGDGAPATTSGTLTVTNANPIVAAGGDVTVEQASPFTRAGSFTDPGTDTWTATVDWGEGEGPVPLSLTGKAFSLSHTFAAIGPFTVTVRVCDDDEGCGTQSFATTVAAPPADPEADLSITKHHDDDLVPGGTVTYTLEATNAGPNTAAGPLTVTDTLPAGLSYVSATGDGWTCAATGSVVTCTRASSLGTGPAPPVLVTAGVAADATVGATIVNSATVSSATPDPDDENNDTDDPGIVAVVALRADLEVTLTGPTEVQAGATGSWSAAVHNAGPDAATDVSAVVTFPAAFTNIGASGAGWSCAGGGPITCTRASLAAGVAANLTLTATAPNDGPAGAPLVGPAAVADELTVAVTAAVADPDSVDNVASLDLAVATTTTTSSSTTSTSSTATTSTTGTSSTTSTTPGSSTSSPSTSIGNVSPSSVSRSSGSSSGVGARTTDASGSLPITGNAPIGLLLTGLASILTGTLLVRARRRLSSRTD